MTQARPADYWFSNSAIFIQLNAAGDRNYIHANCSSGSMIMCYMRGLAGLEYDNGHNYRRWTLVASPTIFHDDLARYVYIAIPKTDAVDMVAQVVFPSEMIDVYGKNETGTQIGPDTHYYIFTQGIISPSRVNGVTCDRTWQSSVDTGQLASDQAIAEGGADSWWEYNATNDMIKFLKTIQEAIFEKLTASWASIKTLVLNNHPIDGVAELGDPEAGTSDTPETSSSHLVTPAYAEKHWLSKTHDDIAYGTITFNNSVTVKGETILKKSVTIGDYEKDIQVGIGSRNGVKMLPDGSIIARSIELSESLNVPTIKYNSIEVLAGTRWDSAGKGRVKELISTNDADHTCQFVLDLNDGEPGEFLVDDILRGFWHSMDGSQNATHNTDDRRGNIQRAGFMSIYARVIKVEDVVERTVDDGTIYIAKNAQYQPKDGDTILTSGLVTVQMRQFQAIVPEAASFSPYPARWSVLSVSGSFSADHPERQKFFVYTTSYIARFDGVNTWEWEEHTFQGGWGDLTGFTMLSTDESGKVYSKEFSGDGFVAGNAHIYGIIDQFTRFSDKISIRLSRPDGTIAEGEKLRADFLLLDIEGNPVIGNKFSITRQSGDSEADATWNTAMATKYKDGIPSALYFEFADVPVNGAVYVVASERSVSSDTGEDTYTTSASFVLSRAYSQEVFLGEWSPTVKYERTARTFPSVTHYGCKWYLFSASSLNDEPLPYSSVWKMMYGIEDMEIRFYNEAGQRITSAAQYPGSVHIYLEPRLLCGNIDITEQLEDTDWSWSRYTGNYGEDVDTRTAADKQSDQGWPSSHPATRIITITNDDMPPTWGSGPIVNFIVTADYHGLLVSNTVVM